MPAVTVAQLQKALASSSHNSTFFMEPGASFVSYANELGPRIYKMGLWPDLLDDRSYLAADGYISLDRDLSTVYSCVINDSPQRVRPAYTDYRALGRTTFLPEVYGLVDKGMCAVRRELATIQGATTVTDITPVTTLHLTDTEGTPTVSATIANASIRVVGFTDTGAKVVGVLTASNDATPVSTIEFATGIIWFDSIQCSDLPVSVELRTDDTDANTMVATLGVGTDVVRYRRYRVGGARSDTYVHLLGKRAWVNVSASTDIIHMGNLAAWKHAMLAKVAEDNGDTEQRAPYHWKQCFEVLNEELNDYLGAAQPTLQLDMWGGACASLQNLM